MLSATARHLRHKEMLLLIPMTMYSGFEQAFYSAEFAKVVYCCIVAMLISEKAVYAKEGYTFI